MEQMGARLWIPPGLVLDEDVLQCLFDFHEPPDTDRAQFAHHVRQLSCDDLQELVEPWLEDLPTGNSTSSSLVKAHCVFLKRTDVEELWQEAGQSEGWRRKDFETFIEFSPAEEFLAIMASVAISTDSNHLRRKARLMISLRAGNDSYTHYKILH
jgi:hypothetical protein